MTASPSLVPDPTKEETRSLRKIRQELNDTRLEPTALPQLPAVSDPPCLIHLYPPTPVTGRRYAIHGDLVVIGRDEDCNIALPEGSVSRRHARIWRMQPGEYQVEDLGSRNGTHVNDVPIVRALLRDGDFLRIGPFIFRFLAGENVEAQYQEEVHRLSIRDPLTGIANRRTFDEFLAREAHRARRHRRSLSIVLFDLDDPEPVREAVGARGYDLLLKELARRLRHDNRAEDLLARFTPQVFAAVLPETDLEGAILYAERLCQSIAEKPFSFEESDHRVSASAGVAVLAAGSELSVSDLVRRAEERLREAKRAGRNSVAPFTAAGRRGAPRPEPEDPPLTQLLFPANRPVT